MVIALSSQSHPSVSKPSSNEKGSSEMSSHGARGAAHGEPSVGQERNRVRDISLVAENRKKREKGPRWCSSA